MLLITGVTGHSGQYFLKELINNNYEGAIRCVVRKTSDTTLIDNSGLKIQKVFGDLNDQEFMNKALIGIDTVMHIGSIFYSVTVMQAAVKNKVRKAIFVHTTGIYSKYKSASADYKIIESNIKEIILNNHSSINLIYLRPTMIYGRMTDNNMIIFIKMIDKFRVLPIIAHGNSLLQPVNGKDLGRAYYQVLNRPSIMKGDYILSGEKPYPMSHIFNTISHYLNKKTKFINVPLNVGIFVARCLKLCTFGQVDYIERVQRMGEDRSFCHGDAKKDFGYKPMPFEEGLKIEIDEYLNYLQKNTTL